MKKLHRPILSTALASSLAAAAPLATATGQNEQADQNDGDRATPRKIFDGKTLDGWSGDPALWKVEDGAIVGRTNAENPIDENTFLIWEGGEIDDFELEFEFMLEGGNSGVQVRSFHLPEIHPWRVGGYQADFDAGNRYTGIFYGEKYRGILAMRGQKTVVGDDHKPVVHETFGDHEEIGQSQKTEGWRNCRVVARGWTIQNFIDGQLTAEVTDEDEAERRRSGLLAFQLHVGEPMTLRVRNVQLRRLPLEGLKKVVFLAGNPSHGWGAHEHYAGCLLLARKLNEAAGDRVLAAVYQNGWPADPSALDNADAVVMYCDGGGGHMANRHLRQLDAVASAGTGIGCIHYGVEVPAGEPGDHMLKWTGGFFETHWSVNPHWTASFTGFPDHPATRGVEPFEIRDEWYYHMRFRPEMDGVTPLLSAVPPAETLNRPDGPHSGNPAVREAVAQGLPQHVMWASENAGGGRGFGFTGGHFHRNWGDDNFRKTVLNAITWIAGAEVPEGGVSTPTPDGGELDANQDEPKPEGR